MKRGFVYPTADVTKVNPNWYYNWGPAETPGVNIPFVPMVWGKKPVNLALKAPIILGFNEPDGAAQSNLTPDHALSLWSGVVSNGLRVGSPATAENPATGTWLNSFKGGYDFVCVHWYAPPNPAGFLKFIDAVYAKFNKPIWITEFAVADWKGTLNLTPAQVLTFMEAVIPELEKRDYVERYAWKTRTVSDPALGASAIFNDDGSLTTLGQYYSTLP